MKALDAKKLRDLEAENARLKRIVADWVLDMSAMRVLLAKTVDAHGHAQSPGLLQTELGLRKRQA